MKRRGLKVKAGNCPRCGQKITKWIPHAVRTWRELGYCPCSLTPVVERDREILRPAQNDGEEILRSAQNDGGE